MPRLIVPILVSAVIAFAPEAAAQREEFTLRAAVLDVVPLSTYSGTVTPVDADPRFALTVRIQSIAPALARFTTGVIVTFAVHSPTRSFGGASAKGKTYEFRLRREAADGKSGFSGLEVRP